MQKKTKASYQSFSAMKISKKQALSNIVLAMSLLSLHQTSSSTSFYLPVAIDSDAIDPDGRNRSSTSSSSFSLPDAIDSDAPPIAHSLNLTPRVLVYDPVAGRRREPGDGIVDGNRGATSETEVLEFAELRVVVPSNGSTEPVKTGKWPPQCQEPFRQVSDSPELVAMADHRGRKPEPNATLDFNYASFDYQHYHSGRSRVGNQRLGELLKHGDAILPDSWDMIPSIRNAAICHIRGDATEILSHFPHFMEVIYRCFGYWLDYGALSDDLTPVLLYNETSQGEYVMQGGILKNEFMKGIREFLGTEIGLTIVNIETYSRCLLPSADEAPETVKLCDALYHPEQTIRTYANGDRHGFIFHGVEVWNRLMSRWLSRKGVLPPSTTADGENKSLLSNGTLSERNTLLTAGKLRRRLTEVVVKSEQGGTASRRDPQDGRSLVSVCSQPPRINILGRNNSRNILNADVVANDLSNFVYVYRKKNGGDDYESREIRMPAVEVMYFEKKTFIEQVQAMQRTDILISGHGAGLTSIPFMATDLEGGLSCKQVLELFPKNYGVPFYFGSLAVQSGLQHSYLYFDDGMDIEDFGNMTTEDLLREPRMPLRKLKPWDIQRANSWKGRWWSRTLNFCPRRNDMVDYVAALITDWYRCHSCLGMTQ